jgi:hypothetical protein
MPAASFNDPGKLVTLNGDITPFADTREDFPRFKADYQTLLAKFQIPGGEHPLGLYPSILVPLQLQQLGPVGEGYSSFAIPIEGQGNAHENAVAQGHFRVALCIHLTNQFARLVSKTTYMSFRTNPLIQIVTLTYAEMYRRLEDEFGELTNKEIKAKVKELDLAAPPGIGYRDIHSAHVTILLDLAANGTTISESLKFEYLITACSNLGTWASEAITDFITDNPARADQTFHRLDLALRAALRNAPSSATTGATYGAHHAVAPALAAAAAITPQPSLNDVMAKILAMEKLMLAPPPAAKAATPQPRQKQDINTPYCWLHGVSGHTSSACKATPRPSNFDASATIALRNGGSTRRVDLKAFP